MIHQIVSVIDSSVGLLPQICLTLLLIELLIWQLVFLDYLNLLLMSKNRNDAT
jgi:hypothetical protein